MYAIATKTDPISSYIIIIFTGQVLQETRDFEIA